MHRSRRSGSSFRRSIVTAVALAGASALAVLGAGTTAQAAATGWSSAASYPITIEDNVVGYDNGVIYSAFGYSAFGYSGLVGDASGDQSSLYAYDVATNTWTQRASAPEARDQASGAFIGGKFYVVGGWTGESTNPVLDIYDPATNTWTTGASAPQAVAAAGSAVLNGKLYVIGGCEDGTCSTHAKTVEVYDPATNSWSAAKSYPATVTYAACDTLGAKIYCAGGSGSATGNDTTAYAYTPGSNRWAKIANLPVGLFGASSVAADGQFVVEGGITDQATLVTNAAYSYNPSTNTWTALPSAVDANFRGGSVLAPYQDGLGFYEIGGEPFLGADTPQSAVQVLGGFTTAG